MFICFTLVCVYVFASSYMLFDRYFLSDASMNEYINVTCGTKLGENWPGAGAGGA